MRSLVLSRRGFLSGVTLALAACKGAERCRNCGMKIDRQSPWRTDLVEPSGGVVAFDTPKCALLAWRTGKVAATGVRLQEYYDRKVRDGADLRFVVGGDVLGPMGPDLVPIEPARATKFIQDHGADKALRLDEVTREVIEALK